MRRHFETELREVIGLILRLGGHVEAAIVKAIQALVERDVLAAKAIIDGDLGADRLEARIDDLCLQILARHQVVGGDLRLVTSALKIAPNLERAADLAASMARRVVDLVTEPALESLLHVQRMGEIAQTMLRQSLDAFVGQDTNLAISTISLDEELDRLMDETFNAGVKIMRDDPRSIARMLRVMMVAKSIERIGDNVTNVCELTVWTIGGRMIRHREFDG